MYWVTDNLRTIDLGQLKNAYYTPGLLARVIKEQRLPDVTGMDTVTLPPILAAWSPDLLFAIAGTYLLLRTPT